MKKLKSRKITGQDNTENILGTLPEDAKNYFKEFGQDLIRVSNSH